MLIARLACTTCWLVLLILIHKPTGCGGRNRRAVRQSPALRRQIWLKSQKKMRKAGQLPNPPIAWRRKRWGHYTKTCMDGECVERKFHVKATLTKQELLFCVGCPDPHQAGSHAPVWNAHFGLWDYHIDAELVMTVPNDASSELLNDYQIYDSVAVVEWERKQRTWDLDGKTNGKIGSPYSFPVSSLR